MWDGNLSTYFDMNLFLDIILKTVLENSGKRRIVFSSFDADICTMWVIPSVFSYTLRMCLGLKVPVWSWGSCPAFPRSVLSNHVRLCVLMSFSDCLLGCLLLLGSPHLLGPRTLYPFVLQAGHILLTIL